LRRSASRSRLEEEREDDSLAAEVGEPNRLSQGAVAGGTAKREIGRGDADFDSCWVGRSRRLLGTSTAREDAERRREGKAPALE
jgi:hypothetical protein